LVFGGYPIPDKNSGLDQFTIFLTIAEQGILGDLLAFLNSTFSYSHRPIFLTKLGEMTGAGNAVNPQHFGRDPADIRIRINPAIRIGIPDHFWLKFQRWRRFAFSEHSLVIITEI